MKPERTNKYKQRVTLLGTIANGSTSNARKLLQKYKQPDATNHKDLEYKLTKLYQTADDKLILEKELAEIHPHKEFILKYCQNENDLVKEPIENTDKTNLEEKSTSNYNGCTCSNPNCPNKTNNYNRFAFSGMDGKSCACGCGTSNFSGDLSPTVNKVNNELMIIGVIGIITIFALTIKR
jgi:hypothetical protein